MEHEPTTAGPPAVRAGSGWRTWGGWFALLTVIGALWAFALPTYSGPDEQAHITKAAAVARGQWQGRHIETVIGTLTEVVVPDAFGDRPADLAKACFAGEPTVPADCAEAPAGSTDDVVAGTYVGRYPPAYYAAVGLATLVAPGTHGLVLMRLASVVLGAAVAASALATATAVAGRSRLLVGVLASFTPMVSYLIGVVNPNGLEVVGALGAATAVTALGLGGDPTHHGTFVRRAAVGFALCTVSRTPSLAFAILAVAIPWLAADRRTRPRLRDLPGLGVAGAIVGAAAAAALGWAWRISSGVGEALTRESVATSIGETAPFTHQSIGVFGEGDAPLPSALWLAWLAVVLVLVVVGLARGSARPRLAILAAVCATVAIPVVAQALAVAPVGARWNGRYQLPATVLVAVVAAGAVGVRRSDRSWLAALVVVTSAVQVGAAFVVARRYEVGTEGPVWFLGAGTWRPAGVTAALLGVAAAAWLLVGVRAIRSLGRDTGWDVTRGRTLPAAPGPPGGVGRLPGGAGSVGGPAHRPR